jgi:hypothetical protein
MGRAAVTAVTLHDFAGNEGGDMRALMAGLLIMVVAGCGTDPSGPADAQWTQISADGLVLTTNQETYAAGDPVVLTLRNETGGVLGHNLCMSVLERASGSQWVSLERVPGDPCPGALELLDPGASASFTHTLPLNLSPGEYRFRTELEKVPTGERGWHVSNTFTVTN